MNGAEQTEEAPGSVPQQPATGPSDPDDPVRGATGRDRDEWFGLLDDWSALGRAHMAIADWLMGEHRLNGWWADQLTFEYEQARGMRPPGKSRDGTFAVSASTTVGAPVDRVFEAFVDTELRERWLPGAPMREPTSTSERTARFDWDDGATGVIVGFTPVSETESEVALSHEHFADAQSAEEKREYWSQRLAALKELLEA